jgi:hypothetical protein
MDSLGSVSVDCSAYACEYTILYVFVCNEGEMIDPQRESTIFI